MKLFCSIRVKSALLPVSEASSGMSRLAIFFLALATICKAGSMCETAPNRQELRKYLTPEGRLQARLVFRDGQQGFAGISGDVWTIEPDGHFSIARFLNEKTDSPHWERSLAPEELKQLGAELAAKNLLALPERFGRDVKVNAHILTLTFGGKDSSLVLNGGETVSDVTTPAGDLQARAWRNFIAIVRTLHKLATPGQRTGPK